MTKEEAMLIIAQCLVEPMHDDIMEECEWILNKLIKAGMRPKARLKHFPEGTSEHRHYPAGMPVDTWEDDDKENEK